MLPVGRINHRSPLLIYRSPEIFSRYCLIILGRKEMRLARNNRALKPEEVATAYSVFLDTMKYDFVRITDGLGAKDLPFTFPGAPL